MADIRPELDFKLYRTIAVGALPDPDWSTTPGVAPEPDNTASIREAFPSKHGFIFTLLLKDGGGSYVAPSNMTYTPQYYAVLTDGNGTDLDLRGADRPDTAPYEAVVEDTIGFGRYAIRIAATANVPVAVASVEIWIKEI